MKGRLRGVLANLRVPWHTSLISHKATRNNTIRDVIAKDHGISKQNGKVETVARGVKTMRMSKP